MRDDLLNGGDVAVIDVRVRNDVDQLARNHIRHLGQHHHQNGVLDHVPVVGRQDVLRALVEDGVELELTASFSAVALLPGHVEGHAVVEGMMTLLI